MQSYIIRRLLLILPTLLIVSIVVFLTVRLIPGDIVDVTLQEMGFFQGEGTLDREGVERMLGLDVPVHVQYGRWLSDIVVHGSLGRSMRNNQPVTQLILERLPTTIELGLLAMLIGLAISLPIGIFSAIRQETWGDYIGRSISIIFIAVPSFWTGTMIMIYPSIWWGWSPPIEIIPFVDDPIGNLGMFIIPAFVLGMALSGTTMRMTRTMMLEILRQDYIRTAWSKGLRERIVIIRHAMKNALIPVITIVGFQVPILVGGSVIVEQIFQLPGIAKLMLEALNRRDYIIVSGVNIFIATSVVIINLLVDLTYAYFDPRVRYK